MKTALLLAAVLLPALARADDKPYAVYNGRGAGTAGGPAPAAAAPAAPSGAAGAQTSNQLVDTALQQGAFGTSGVKTGLLPASGGSGEAFSGRSGRTRTRGFGGFGRSLKARRGAAPTSGGSTGGSGAPTSDPPPYYSKPGALIRTEGQLPKYEAANNGGTTSVEGGGFVQIDQSKAVDVAKAPGIAWAPPDGQVRVNSGAGSGSGASANPGNTTIVNNDHSGNVNGNQNGGGGNGHGNGNQNGQGQDNQDAFNPSF